jgi:hypothetical protein
VIQRVGLEASSSRKVEYCSRMVWRARMGIEGVGVCVLLYWAIRRLGVVEWGYGSLLRSVARHE